MPAHRLEPPAAIGEPDATPCARPITGWERELAQVERARRDPAAFAPLYEAYADLVWRYALSRLRDRERAADAVSQTFTKALGALTTFRPERRGSSTTFRSWLMTIARNVVFDEGRATRSTIPLDAPATQPWLIAGDRSPEDSALAAAERQRIDRALAQLPETQRQIVELRAIGMKGVEIAGALNMSITAVKVANHRAYHRLRELLDERRAEQDMHS